MLGLAAIAASFAHPLPCICLDAIALAQFLAAIAFTEYDDRFVDITNFDPSKGNQDRADEGDFIRSKSNHWQSLD